MRVIDIPFDRPVTYRVVRDYLETPCGVIDGLTTEIEFGDSTYRLVDGTSGAPFAINLRTGEIVILYADGGY